MVSQDWDEMDKGDLLQKLLDTTQTMIFWKDRDRRFRGVNQAFLDYYGFASQELLLGKTDEELGWHANPDPFQDDEWRVLNEGCHTYMVHGKCMARGAERDILASKKPLLHNGKIIGLVGSFVDITERLRQENEIARLNRKLDGIPGGIAIYRRRYGEMVCVSVNQCLVRMLGTDAGSVIGKNLHQLQDCYMMPTERARFFQDCAFLCGNHRHMSGTYQFYNRVKKQPLWLQINCQLVRDPEDEELVYCTYTNVDKLVCYEKEVLNVRHLAEERYAHAMQLVSENRLQNLVSRGHYNFTRNSILSFETYVDNVYVPTTTMTYDEAFAGMMAMPYVSDDRQHLAEKLERRRVLQAYERGETSSQTHYRRILPGNEPIWLSIVMDSFVNPKTGDIEGLSFVYDITAQILEGAIINRLGNLGYDELGLVYSNSGFWRCYRYDGPSATDHYQMHSVGSWKKEIERYIREEVTSEQHDKVRHELSLPNILVQLAEQDVYVCTQTTQQPDGSVRQKEIKFSYLNEVRETIFYCMSDITEQFVREHQQIAALKMARQEAETANETRAAFFASISHDMRTPLNGVLGYTDLALEVKDMEAVQEYLSKIRISGYLLLELINDVLDFGKYVSNKIKLKQEPVHLDLICRDVDTVIRPLAEKKSIEFRMKRQPPYTGLVLADSLRIQQLLVNLLSNAVKFTRHGGLVECLLTEEETKTAVNCRVVVRDNGMGMSAEFLPHIFDPYSQEERVTVSRTIGTGLGMAIVKQIVDLMGGQITVDSILDTGTTFQLCLQMPKYEGKDHRRELPASDTYTTMLKGKRVLLCEDNELNAEIATLLLEHWGMDVTWKDDGQQALLAMQQAPLNYDVILMDKRMPVMDGLEATRSIREMEAGKARHIPIIAMTGDVDDESIQSCLEAGMDSHVGKPVNREKLVRALIRLL